MFALILLAKTLARWMPDNLLEENFVGRWMIDNLLEKVWNLSNPKPEHTTGGRIEAAHGGAAGRGGAGQNGTPTDRLAQETSDPRNLQGIEHTCPERLFRSTNK